MVVLEVLFLAIFWAWVFSAALFLRNTYLPRMPISNSPASWDLPFESVQFPATDGIGLSGWKIAAHPQDPWIILCHGLGANRADLLEIAAALSQGGYNLLLFDFRSHGGSRGRVTSFGWLEQHDLEGALTFLGAQPGIPERPYGVFGISMGGAVAIMVAARDERLGVVVVDSPYSNLEDSIAHHMRLFYRLPRVPFLLFVRLAYRLRFGVWPGQMSPVSMAPKISPRPLLILHGGDDPQTPLVQAQTLYEAAKQPKELWVIQGNGHLGSFRTDPEAYLRRVVEFFDSYLKN